MTTNIKTIIIAWAGVVALGISILSYIVRLETKFAEYDRLFDLSERIGQLENRQANTENMIYPVLVEMEVRKRMSEMKQPEPISLNDIPDPAPPPPPPPPIQAEVEQAIERQIQSVSPEFRR